MMTLVQKLINKGYLVETEIFKTDIYQILSKFDENFLLETILSNNPPKIINKEFFINLLPSFIETLKENNEFTSSEELNFVLQKYLKKEKKEEQQPPKEKIILFDYEFKPKKIEVEDFVNYFRERYKFFKNILQERNLENLTSIGKISGNKKNVTIIGLVYDKKQTKNKNLVIELEDPTGKIKVLINKEKKEIFEKASNVVLDEVIAVKGSGNREILFAEDIFFPEISPREIKKSDEEINVAFIADLHVGSNKFLEENFLRFVSWINGELGNEQQKRIAEKVKYLFVVGDIVDGIGIYPNQEKELKIKDLYEQYRYAAYLLKKIRKDVKIILCPGNHDGVRLMEPQPKFDPEVMKIFDSENFIFTTNPSIVTIEKKENFSGFDILLYHGRSLDYYIDQVDSLRLSNARFSPGLVLNFLLKKRHLAPTHASTNIIPMEDVLCLRKVPDIIVTAHIHRSGFSNYNNLIVISCSCFQGKTSYQEKLGHEPDPCKVCVLNLKTRKINVLDFS